MNKPLTEQQKKVVTSNSKLIAVNAFAGTGKTYTLEAYSNQYLNDEILYLAYNKSMQEEAKKSFPHNVECHTIHSLAFKFEGSKYKNKLLTSGNYRIAELCNALNNKHEFVLNHWIVNVSYDILKAWFYSVDKNIIDFIPEYLQNNSKKSNFFANQNQATKDIIIETAKLIWHDMQDQENTIIKMPHDGYLKLFQLSDYRITKYNRVLLDEAQDSNSVTVDIFQNKIQADYKVMVGDIYQAIYQFRGSINALSDFQENAESVYLTKSFRFGQDIAGLASNILKVFRCEKRSLTGMNNIDSEIEIIDSVTDLLMKDNNFDEPIVLLSRGNGVLFKTSFEYIRHQKIPYFQGGIERYELDLIRAICEINKEGRIVTPKYRKSYEYLNEYGDINSIKVYAESVDELDLLSFCILVDQFGSDKVNEYIDKIILHEENINNRIKDKNKKDNKKKISSDFCDIILVTAHRSKGIEYQQVVITNDFTKLIEFIQDLNNNRKISLKPVDYQAETNLFYVAVTRAVKKLYIEHSKIVDFIKGDNHQAIPDEYFNKIPTYIRQVQKLEHPSLSTKLQEEIAGNNEFEVSISEPLLIANAEDDNSISDIIHNYFSKLVSANKITDIRDFLAIIKNPANKILKSLKMQFHYLSLRIDKSKYSLGINVTDEELIQLIINLLKTDDNIRDNILKVDENEFTKRFIHTLKSYNKKVLETISQLKNKNKDSDNKDLDSIDPSKFSEFYSALVSLVSSYGFYYSLKDTPAGKFLNSVVETKIHYKPMTGPDPTSEYGVNVYFTVSFLMKIKEQVPDLMSAEVALHLFNRFSVISSRSFFSKGVDGKVSELRGSSVDDYINTLTVTPYSLHKVLPEVKVSVGDVNSRFSSEGITKVLMPSILNFYGVDSIISGISEVLTRPKQFLKKLLDVPYDVFLDKKLQGVIMQSCIKGFIENKETLNKINIKPPETSDDFSKYYPLMLQLIKNNISGNSSSTKLTDEEAKNINDLTAIATCYSIICGVTNIILAKMLPSLNDPYNFNEFVGELSGSNKQIFNITGYLESFDKVQLNLKKVLKITSDEAIYVPSNVNFDIYGKSGLSDYFRYLTELSKKVKSKISDAMMKQLVRDAKIDFAAIQNSLKELKYPEELEEFESTAEPLKLLEVKDYCIENFIQDNYSILKASTRGHTELVRLLLILGENVELRDSNGYTALIIASEYGFTEIVKLLIDAGADVNVKIN